MFSLDFRGFDARNRLESAFLHYKYFFDKLLKLYHASALYAFVYTVYNCCFFSNMKFMHLLILNKINIYLFALFAVFSIGAPQVILLYLHVYTCSIIDWPSFHITNKPV